MEYNKFERARLLGARALQLSLGAPPLVEVGDNAINPIAIARGEFKNGILPLAVVR